MKYAHNQYCEVCCKLAPPIEIDTDWLRQVGKEVLCPECGTVRQQLGAVSVAIARMYRPFSLQSLDASGLAIASTSFLSSLGNDLGVKDLYLGDVFDSKGKLIPNYRTVRGRELAHIRGSRRSSARTCGICGRIFHYPWPPHYLVHRSVGDRLAYENQMGQLIMNLEAAQRLSVVHPKDFSVFKLPWQEKCHDSHCLPCDQLPIRQGTDKAV